MVFQDFIVLFWILNPSLETWEWENIHCLSSFQFVCFYEWHLPNLHPLNKSNFGKNLPVKQPLRFIHTKMQETWHSSLGRFRPNLTINQIWSWNMWSSLCIFGYKLKNTCSLFLLQLKTYKTTSFSSYYFKNISLSQNFANKEKSGHLSLSQVPFHWVPWSSWMGHLSAYNLNIENIVFEMEIKL